MRELILEYPEINNIYTGVIVEKYWPRKKQIFRTWIAKLEPLLALVSQVWR